MKHISDHKDERITEKAFMQSTVISVVSILLCIVALCSVTFCWYTGKTESKSNMLMSGYFGVTATVMSENGIVPVTPHSSREGVFECRLPGGGTYTVMLELESGSTVKGHCVVTVGDDDPRHTAAIIGAEMANETGSQLTEPFFFTITVQQATVVTFEPRWGVVVEPDIAYQGAYPTT